MIGDVLMPHRKVEVIRPSQPYPKVGQERCDAALGILTHQQGMFLGTPQLVRRYRQQEVGNSTFSGCNGKQCPAFNEQYHCVCGGFDRKVVVCTDRTKQITGKIKSDDVAGPVLERLAMADDPADHKEHVIGDVSFAGDDVVALETDGAALKRGESTFQELLIAERFGEIYRPANNALSLWRYKWRAAEFNDAHWCCPLNVHLPQPAPPCGRRWRPNELLGPAPSDREMSRLENGILPPVRDTAHSPAIALRGLCVA